MKYYVIINGVSSETIQGLAIESLPAISKPLQRSKQETIDGRDGDIITKLGYSAYDKTLKIGLWGNYDINEVIKYFDTEGTITFSNEPDMYYNFNILNRIDFINQLEAFRKATITIHCQPFKYKEEETETLELEEYQATGTDFNLEGTYEAPMQIDLKGNTSQVPLSGKNLFNPIIVNNGTPIYTSNCNVSVSNGVISLTATATGRIDFGSGRAAGGTYEDDRGVLIAVEPNTTYQISLSNQTFPRVYINKWNSSKVSLGGNSLYLPNTSYTTDANTYYISLDLVYADAVSGTTYSTTIQVEEGSTPTSYEQYVGGTPSPNPSYPQDIHNVSGNNSVVVCGKNILNEELAKNVSNYTESIGSSYYGMPIQLMPNTIYTISTFVDSPVSADNSFILTVRRYETPTQNLFIINSESSKPTITNESYTFETGESGILYLVERYGSTEKITSILNQVKLQIEESNQATTYEAYNGTTYPINLGSIELCKIGTYQDYIYKEDDKWYLHKETGKIVLDGSEQNWNSSTSNYYITIDDAMIGSAGLSNYFIYSSTIGTFGYFRFSGSQHWLIFMSVSTQYTRQQWLDWLSTHNTNVYYVLATPTNTEITDTTLIEQLNAIKEAQTYTGTTNILQTNNDLPFILDIDYFTGTNEITITNNGNTYSKPVLTLVGSGVIGIYLNDSQIFQVSLGTDETIIIDINNMEAYYDATLKNRQVIGDYNNFRLIAGENKIKLTGNWDKLSVDNYSRWI